MDVSLKNTPDLLPEMRKMFKTHYSRLVSDDLQPCGMLNVPKCSLRSSSNILTMLFFILYIIKFHIHTHSGVPIILSDFVSHWGFSNKAV